VDHAENENGLVTGVAATIGAVLLLIKENKEPAVEHILNARYCRNHAQRST
jgi:hypothetical protein